MESLRRELIDVAFSPYEADVYLALLKEHPVNGSQLARRSGVPRSMVYQTLDRLVEKGAVLAAPGDPSLYAPVPPAEFLGRLKERFAATCDDLIESLPRFAETGDAQMVWNLKGIDSIRARAEALFARAGSRLRTGGDPDLLPAVLPRFALARRGKPALTKGSCVLVVPDQEAMLVHAAPWSEPVAAYGRHPALVAAATALVLPFAAGRSRAELAVPTRQIW